MFPKLKEGWNNVPYQVRILGFVSFLTDVSSEMIYPLLPYFLTSVIGASAMALGTIEGTAESVASILKALSGMVSDRLKRRKPLIVTGYSISSIAKPTIGLAVNPFDVFIARILDRTGKGLRTSPRDALIRESSPPDKVGRSFGFHRSLDTAGAVIGPLLATILLWILRPFVEVDMSYRIIFLFSLVPGLLSVFLLVKGVKEMGSEGKSGLPKFGRLPYRGFWLFVLFMGIFSLGNSSDTFVLLRATNLGLNAALVPLFYLLFNVVYTLFAAPMGIISDKLGRRRTLSVGFLVYSLTYFMLAHRLGLISLLLTFVLYGFYYSIVEGVARATVSDLVPKDVSGTAYGYFHMVVGVLLLPASLIAGFLWERVGPDAPFLFGSVTSLIAAISFLLWSYTGPQGKIA